MNFPDALSKAADSHPYDLLFATISGAHLYGFPSPDSDFDLRGAHVLPLSKVVGLEVTDETIELAEKNEEIDLDLVTHDVKKFFNMMLKKNGYVLEQLHSPLIIRTSPEHDELKEIAKDCVTKHHHHHYSGFAFTQWTLFNKEEKPRVKPLLYVYRVLLTGINLMRTGVIEADLTVLNDEFKLSHVKDLITRKRTGAEKQYLQAADMALHEREYNRLNSQLDEAFQNSKLPEAPSARPAIDDLLKRIRLKRL